MGFVTSRRLRERSATLAIAVLALSACDNERALSEDVGRRSAPGEAAARARTSDGTLAVRGDPPFDAGAALSRSGTSYVGRSTVVVSASAVTGRVRGGERLALDTTVVPTHDLSSCRAFSEPLVSSRADGIGDVVVWLDGVSAGPMDTSPRRAVLRLSGCRLSPGIQRVATGGTVLLSSADPMRSRLTFRDEGSAASTRDVVSFSDDGQTVPSSRIAARPGIVAVRDDLHPWVHAWIVVTPHPFVAITGDDGAFRFDSVPPGSYTLMAWSARLGVRSRPIRVSRGKDNTVEVTFP